MNRAGYALVLLVLGAGWGLTHPLGKIATEGGEGPLGLIFWQQVVCVAVLGGLMLVRRRPVPLTRAALRFYGIVAVVGTLIPNTTYYISAAHLPSGIMSILISTVPLMSLPIALALGLDRFSLVRLFGLVLGLVGVALIALPKSSLPDPAMAAFLPIAALGPMFYAIEANYVARFGTVGLDPVQASFGAALAALVLCLPASVISGQFYLPQWPLQRPDLALVASSVIHAMMYTGFVWLAASAGAVFAAQTSYLVTAWGILSAMLLLGERFPATVWLALVVMLAGVALVNPRPKAPEPAHA